MRRITMLLGLSALLVGLALSGPRAQQISISTDPNSPDMLVDVSLRDADLAEVLTALFNTTNGRYQFSIGGGVVGRIPRLQLTQTPFEKALDAILGTDYSYTKQQTGSGAVMYRISGRMGTTPSPTTPPTGLFPTLAPPTSSLPKPAGAASALGAILSFPTKTGAGFGKTGTGTGTGTEESPAASETSVLKLIGVSNLDLVALCSALGAQTIALFNTAQYGGQGGYGQQGQYNTGQYGYNTGQYGYNTGQTGSNIPYGYNTSATTNPYYGTAQSTYNPYSQTQPSYRY